MSTRRRCAVPDCRHAPSAHGERGCDVCLCDGWLDKKPHTWRDECVDAWFFATHAWWLAAEAAANGYRAELAEFAEHHPRPRLQDFMKAKTHGTPPDQLQRLTSLDVCPSCRGTGRVA